MEVAPQYLTRSGRPASARRANAAALAACTVASLLLFHRIALHPTSAALFGGRSDPGQVVWFLEWTARCVVHGRNPLLTDTIFAPQGTNLMWNTLMLVPGVVLAPVTLTLGPVVSLNVLMVSGPALTAWTGWLWLRRHVDHWLGALAGGLFLGFCGFQAAEAVGHVHVSFLPLVPVTLILLEDLLWRAPARRVQRGALLGFVLAVQALISEEVVLLLAIGVLVVVLGSLVLRPRATAAAIRGALAAGAMAVGVFALLLAWPLATQLFGPNQASGVTFPTFAAEPRDLFVPTSHYLLSGAHADAALTLGRENNAFESGSYLGVPLVLGLLAGVVALWRRWEVWVAGGTAFVAFVLTLGRAPGPVSAVTWRRPLGPLLHLPLLENVVAPRFSLLSDLGVAFVAALVIDHVTAAPLVRRSRAAATVAMVCLGVIAASLLPAGPVGDLAVRVPPWFRSPSVERIPEGVTVAVLPTPPAATAGAMLWTATAHLRFKTIGGYGYVRTPDDVLRVVAAPDPITVLATRLLAGGPPPNAEEVRGAQGTLRVLGVRAVLVVAGEDPHGGLAAAAEAVLGPRPAVDGGVLVWRL